MTERYCVPTSWPWRLSVVGSCTVKNTSSRSLSEITFGSNVIWLTSACPVRPVHTCSYDGFATVPPEKPDSTFSTPFSSSTTASVHQKQPPPSVIVSRAGACALACVVGAALTSTAVSSHAAIIGAPLNRGRGMAMLGSEALLLDDRRDGFCAQREAAAEL